jgi:hypothetical protein
MRTTIFAWVFPTLLLISSCREGDLNQREIDSFEKHTEGVSLEVHHQEYECGVVRVTCYLVNSSGKKMAFATTPLDSRSVPTILKDKKNRRLVLMVSVMRAWCDVDRQVYRDSDLGRVVLEDGDVFALFSSDFPKKELSGWTVEAVYIAFPEKPYRDYWSGEVAAKASSMVGKR